MVGLQDLVDAAWRSSVFQSKRLFNIHRLMTCLVVSGYLHNASSLREMLQHVLRCILPEPKMCEQLEAIVKKHVSLPSRTTLYRHRLTLTMGYYRWLAAMHTAMLSSTDGIVRWGTLDASPQGEWDWVLMGTSTMRSKDLPHCFDLAFRLHAIGSSRSTLAEPSTRELDVCDDLCAKLVMTEGVPCGVGSGKASLRHKLHALMHSHRLISSSWDEAIQLVASTCTWTGDLGTESRIVLFHDTLENLMGSWVFQTEEASPTVFSFSSDCSGPGNNCLQWTGKRHSEFWSLIDLRPSVYLGGILHITHNLTEDLAHSLGWWPDYIQKLAHISRMLRKLWSRQRLLETCYSSESTCLFRSMIEKAGNVTEVYEGRWGSISHATDDVLSFERCLRAGWSEEKFGATHSKQMDTSIVESAVHSPFFWAYAFMISRLGATLQAVSNWSERCPCHDASQSLSIYSGKPCPMAGRRAPEMAAGELLKEVSNLCDETHANILLNPNMCACSLENQKCLIDDFSAARRHLLFGFGVKLHHWRELPWLLFGCAHFSPPVARECAREALQIFAGQGLRGVGKT